MEEEFDKTTLEGWLAHIERLHSKPIDMGLERMHEMVKRMGIAFESPVITVAGTNGKGSTCAMLESIYREAGFATGMHTSPHLLRFNERAVVNGREATNEELMAVFAEVEDARGGMTLSYFEFTGLAILRLFQKMKLDVVILEIGLGGRLDAMNAIDADASVIAAVGIDHTAFLGTTREEIGLEKAHIYRHGCPAICSDLNPPGSVRDYAKNIGAKFLSWGEGFEEKKRKDGSFDFFFERKPFFCGLPRPALAGESQYRNAAGALAAIASLNERLPVTDNAVRDGLRDVRIAARFETVAKTPCPIILDVGHNPQAAEVLAQNIALTKAEGEATIAVFGMLIDKDRTSVCRIMKNSFDKWFVSGLPGERGASLESIAGSMREAGIDASRVVETASVEASLKAARNEAAKLLESGGAEKSRPVRIIVFGSFVTVTGALEALRAEGVLNAEGKAIA